MTISQQAAHGLWRPAGSTHCIQTYRPSKLQRSNWPSF